jgi:hypothetical protein
MPRDFWYVKLLTITWDIHPDTVLVKCFFVSIEALEAALDITGAGSIHWCILLMSEDNAWTRNALTVGFCTLPTDCNKTLSVILLSMIRSFMKPASSCGVRDWQKLWMWVYGSKENESTCVTYLVFAHRIWAMRLSITLYCSSEEPVPCDCDRSNWAGSHQLSVGLQHPMDNDIRTIRFLIASCATGFTNHRSSLVLYAFNGREGWENERAEGWGWIWGDRVVLQAWIY